MISAHEMKSGTKRYIDNKSFSANSGTDRRVAERYVDANSGQLAGLRSLMAMFIQTEATPDPKTLKFLPGREVLARGPVELRDEGQAVNSPLGKTFCHTGRGRLTFGSDYIDITQKDSDWHQLKPMILGAIVEHFMTGAPVFNPSANPNRPRVDSSDGSGRPDSRGVAPGDRSRTRLQYCRFGLGL